MAKTDSSFLIAQSNLDGKALAEKVRARVADQVKDLKSQHNLTPGLAVVMVGDDPASHVYVRNKNKSTVEAGMKSFEHQLPAETSQKELLTLIDGLNNDPAVHGILVQLPLPAGFDEEAALERISPEKDADGLLSMDEILGMRLNADWVVLSACNTASGDGAGSEAVTAGASSGAVAGTGGAGDGDAAGPESGGSGCNDDGQDCGPCRRSKQVARGGRKWLTPNSRTTLGT